MQTTPLTKHLAAAPPVQFQRLAQHLSDREKPGYYLILLRSELRHRSLRKWRATGE